jgi:hypothetical protein
LRVKGRIAGPPLLDRLAARIQDTMFTKSTVSRLTFTKPEETPENPNPDPTRGYLNCPNRTDFARASKFTCGAPPAPFMRMTPGTGSNPANEAYAEELFLELMAQLAAQGGYPKGLDPVLFLACLQLMVTHCKIVNGKLVMKTIEDTLAECPQIIKLVPCDD